MAGQRGQHFGEGVGGIWVGVLREVPLRFVQNGAAAFLAAQIKDGAELGIHGVALGICQSQPVGKQFVVPGL